MNEGWRQVVHQNNVDLAKAYKMGVSLVTDLSTLKNEVINIRVKRYHFLSRKKKIFQKEANLLFSTYQEYENKMKLALEKKWGIAVEEPDAKHQIKHTLEFNIMSEQLSSIGNYLTNLRYELQNVDTTIVNNIAVALGILGGVLGIVSIALGAIALFKG